MARFLVPPSLRQAHERGLARFLETGEGNVLGRVVELPALRADGSEFPVELAVTRVEGHAPPLFTASIRNLTDRKREADRFRYAIEAAPTGMIMVDQDGRMVLVNARVEKLLGYQRDELIGGSVEMLVPELRRAHPDFRQAFAQDPKAPPMGAGRDLFALRKDGTKVPVEIALNPFETPEGRFVLTSVVDVTERKRAEADRGRLLGELQSLNADLERRVAARTRELTAAHHILSESEARFRALFDDSPISLWEEDFSDVSAYFNEVRASGVEDLHAYLASHPDVVRAASARVKVLAVNQAAMKLYETGAVDQSPALPHVFGSEDIESFRAVLSAFLERKPSFEAETVTRTMTGRPKDISLRLSVLPGCENTWSRVVVSIFDLTAYKKAERALRTSIQEKEVLLKEIHHRVKNNLQVISSLLNLQAQHLPDQKAREGFAESQGRVQSIALVHEWLYRSKNLSQVSFNEYVRELVASLFYSFDAEARGIESRIDVPPSVRLAVDKAIPCGLIVNELVTNSLKHAFPDSRKGTIEVTLRPADSERFELICQDDGIGLPSGFDPRQAISLGLDLVFTFAEQLQAGIDVLGEHGTTFCLRFPTAGP